MTAESVIRDLGADRAAAEAALAQEKARHEDTSRELDWWQQRAGRLQADLDESMQADLLGRYRRACVEKAAAERRVRVLEAELVTARAEAEALKGNR